MFEVSFFYQTNYKLELNYEYDATYQNIILNMRTVELGDSEQF